MWNKYLPYFDSTREDQEFKTFADLPSDLPFNYGSLTDCLVYIFPVWVWIVRNARFRHPCTGIFHTSDIHFEEGEFVTSLTQSIQPHTVVSDWCGIGPDRYPKIGDTTREYQGESLTLTSPNIPPVFACKTVALFQFHLLIWIILTTSCLGNGFAVVVHFHSRTLGFLQHPRSSSRRPVSGPGLSVCSEWLVLNIFPTTDLHPFSRKDFHVYSEEVLSSDRIWQVGSPHQRPFQGLLTFREQKHKKPLRVSQRPISISCFKGSSWSVTSIPSIIPCLTITLISFSVDLLNHIIRVLCSLRFLFVVYEFELIVMVCLVSLVLVSVVLCFSGCVSSPILVVQPSMSVCMYHLYIYLFVCIICLTGTWCAFIFKQHRLHCAS